MAKRILTICSDESKGVLDYVNNVQNSLNAHTSLQVCVKTLHKQSLYSNEENVKDNLTSLLTPVNFDAIHIHYSWQLFNPGACLYTSLELFAWFINHIHTELKLPIYITFHGYIHMSYGEGLASNIQTSLTRKYFNKHVVPAINRCEVVVHTYNHRDDMMRLGIENIHIIPPGVKRHNKFSRISRGSFTNKKPKIVIPGIRSRYKNYIDVIRGISQIDGEYEIFISDYDNGWSDSEIFECIRDSGCRDKVKFTTFSKDKNDYLDQLSQFDIAILPYNEPIPHSGSLQDCLSVGLFCITQNTVEFNSFKERFGCIETTHDFSLSLQFYINRFEIDKTYRTNISKSIKNYIHQQSHGVMCELYSNLYNVESDMIVEPQHKHPGRDIINIFMCCRDNEETIGDTLAKLRLMELRSPQYTFKYYILENDSVDNTPRILEDFYKVNKGNLKSYKTTSTKWSSEPGSGRIRDMAKYRNEMKALCTDWNKSSYSFIIDSELKFDLDIIDTYIRRMDSMDQCAMLTPYGTVGDSSVYYDSFAFRNTSNTNEFHLKSNTSPFEVNSAFGGFVCIRTHVLEKCRWDIIDGQKSEHIPFCEMVRKYGTVMIDPTIVVEW